MKKLNRTITIVLFIAMMSGMLILAIPNGSVSAASLKEVSPTDTPVYPEEKVNERLEKKYARLQDWLAKQAENISKLDNLADKVQERIDKLNDRGLDTTSLETALSSFKAGIPAIQASHEGAAAILTAHTGFDGDGKVTDATSARSTLESARLTLKDTRSMLRKTAKDLMKALREFREANPIPTAIPTEIP